MKAFIHAAVNRSGILAARIPYRILINSRCELISDPGWIKRLLEAYKKSLLLFSDLSVQSFFSKCAAYINEELSDGEKGRLSELLTDRFTKCGSQEKMFIHCIMAMCHLLDEKTVAVIMRDLLAAEDPGYRYWLGLDISHSTFVSGAQVYPDFYNDRKKLLKIISEESGLRVPQRNNKGDGLRICIIAYQLNPDMHNSSQRVCSMIANNLSCFSDEMMVLCNDSTYLSKKEKHKYFTIMRNPKSDNKSERVRKNFNDNVEVRFAKGRSCLERTQNMLDILYEYDPAIIIDISDEYSPLSNVYAKDFFTVYNPLRVGVSSQCFDRIAAPKMICGIVNSKYNNVLDEKQILDWIFPEYVPKQTNDLSKKDLGISEDSFVIATIGNNGAINKDLIDEMAAFLRREQNYIWLLVGDPSADYLKSACKDLIEKRIVIEWGYERNLAGICAACDAVLRPDISGGSGGTAIAAMKGLPVVMTEKICDASRWLGVDYSVIGDCKGQIAEIMKLRNDPEYYIERQTAIMGLVSRAVDSKERWKELFVLLTKAEMEWKQKKGIKCERRKSI